MAVLADGRADGRAKRLAAQLAGLAVPDGLAAEAEPGRAGGEGASFPGVPTTRGGGRFHSHRVH